MITYISHARIHRHGRISEGKDIAKVYVQKMMRMDSPQINLLHDERCITCKWWSHECDRKILSVAVMSLLAATEIITRLLKEAWQLVEALKS